MFWKGSISCSLSVAIRLTFVRITGLISLLQRSKTGFRRVRIEPIRIHPGSPWENGYKGRFDGTQRPELLNAEWFATPRQAQIFIDTWLRQYNYIPPHHALGICALAPETILEKLKISGSEQRG